MIVILALTNPDGMTMIADWYNGNIGTNFETAPTPFLYQKYAGHDNNRESHMANLQEIQNVNKLFNQLPDQRPQQIIEGHATGTMPQAYVGGITEEGMDYNTDNPLPYGMQERNIAYVSGQYALDIVTDSSDVSESPGNSAVRVVARFPDEPLLLSGFLAGEERLRGKASIVEAEVGQGRVVLFGFNVQNRAQAFATHKLLYNAVFGDGR